MLKIETDKEQTWHINVQWSVVSPGSDKHIEADILREINFEDVSLTLRRRKHEKLLSLIKNL